LNYQAPNNRTAVSPPPPGPKNFPRASSSKEKMAIDKNTVEEMKA